MSSRFGRNKRRAFRECIAELERKNSQLKRDLNWTQKDRDGFRAQAHDAFKRALDTLVSEKDNIALATETISKELARSIGPKYVEAIEQLWAAERDNRNRGKPMFDLSAAVSADSQVITVRGVIRELHYAYQFRKGF